MANAPDPNYYIQLVVTLQKCLMRVDAIEFGPLFCDFIANSVSFMSLWIESVGYVRRMESFPVFTYNINVLHWWAFSPLKWSPCAAGLLKNWLIWLNFFNVGFVTWNWINCQSKINLFQNKLVHSKL